MVSAKEPDSAPTSGRILWTVVFQPVSSLMRFSVGDEDETGIRVWRCGAQSSGTEVTKQSHAMKDTSAKRAHKRT